MTALGFGAAFGVVTLLWLQRRLPRIDRVLLRGDRHRRVPRARGVVLDARARGVDDRRRRRVRGHHRTSPASPCCRRACADELRGRTFATLYTVVRLCLLISLTISPLWADFWDWVTQALLGERPVGVDRAVHLRAPRRAHRALGRRAHHVRRRVLRLALDPQGRARRRPRPASRRWRRRVRSSSARSGWSSRRRSREAPSRRRDRRRRSPSPSHATTPDGSTARGRRASRSRSGTVTRGRFVVLEGGDGSGKSTQATRPGGLAARRRTSTVVETFEPGAAPTGAVLRDVLLHGPEPVAPGRRSAADGRRPRPARRHRDRARARARRLGGVRPVRAVVARVPGRRARPRASTWSSAQRRRHRRASRPISCSCSTCPTPSPTRGAGRRRATGSNAKARRSTPSVRAAYRDLAPARGWIVIDADGDVDAVAERVRDAVEPLLAG